MTYRPDPEATMAGTVDTTESNSGPYNSLLGVTNVFQMKGRHPEGVADYEKLMENYQLRMAWLRDHAVTPASVEQEKSPEEVEEVEQLEAAAKTPTVRRTRAKKETE